MTNSARILVLVPDIPWPLRQGAAIRNFHIIRGLARRHNVTVLGFGDPEAEYRPLVDAGARVFAVPKPEPRSSLRRAGELFTTATPDLARRLRCETMQAAARLKTMISEPFDALQIEGLEMAPYALDILQSTPSRHRTRLVYDAHNAEWQLQARAFSTDRQHPLRWPAAVYSLIQTLKLRRYERRLLRTAWATIAVSEADATVLRRLSTDARIVVAPNGVDTSFFFPADASGVEPGLLVFTGKMDFRPNVDAVLWFSQAVWPEVRRRSPKAQFAIVGRDPSPAVKALAREPGIVVTGAVPDVRPWIGRAGVFVAPLRVGGGTRLKVLEAMAMAKPIVATSMAIEGLHVEPGEEVIVADDPMEMARQIVELAFDPVARESLGQAARRRAEFEYRWENVAWQVESIYRQQ